MKCERCEKNPARVRIDEIDANGQRVHHYLCQSCVEELMGAAMGQMGGPEGSGNPGGAPFGFVGSNGNSPFAGGKNTATAERQAKHSKTPTLDQYGRDLTAEAADGKLDPTAGRERELRRVITVLGRRQKNNPVLIGEPGVGKTAIVEGLARSIQEGKVPATLRNKRIVTLNIGGMVAGAMFRGQFEQRIKSILEELREAKDVIVFIDELHTVVGAGAAEGAVGAADMLKPALARGELRCIGATTLDEYRKHIENRKEAAANAEDYERAAKYRQQELVTQSKLDKARAESGGSVTLIVTPEHVAQVVENWTGVPVSQMLESERQNLRNLEEDLRKRVVGQDEAISAVARAIRRSRAGLKDPKRPIGSFLFLGPTGVGKTELAKALAAELFGGEDAMIRLDMSEYMESHTVSRLFGSPPGYVGYDEGGQLTEQVRRRPYSVILFDEIEKAHPEVFNALLQIMDDGRLTDGQGRTVDFKNTVVIMTSNAGSTELKRAVRIGFSQRRGDDEGDEQHEVMRSKAMEGLKRMFRPEFINRIDQIVVFHSLGKAELYKIVDLLLAQVRSRLSEQKIDLVVSDEARDFLLREGFDEEYGARPLRRAIQTFVDDTLADALLAGEIAPDQTALLTVRDGQMAIEVQEVMQSQAA